MANELADEVYRCGQDILAAEPSAAPAVLDEVLNRFVGMPFRAQRGFVVDRDGNRSPEFCSIIRRGNGDPDQPTVAADDVAAVVDYLDQLDLESFRAAYRRIAAARQLGKSLILQSRQRTNLTMGLILARTSTVSLEDLAEEIYRLDLETPNLHWPNLVAIASTGIVNYAGALPRESCEGDLLPLMEQSLGDGPPPIYVPIVMRPTALHTFNRFLAVLAAHLSAFSPERGESRFETIVEGASPNAVILRGFQPDLQGRLKPLPRNQFSDRLMRRSPITIEDRRGTGTSMIEYLPWQDGGVILLSGKLPLERLLVLMPGLRAEQMRVIERKDYQCTPVLPVSEGDFYHFLNEIAQRTRYVVNAKPVGSVIQKVMDEGVGTPFIARCWLGLLRLRADTFPAGATRDALDIVFENALSSLMTTRASAKQVAMLWQDHRARVQSGEIAVIDGPDIRIMKGIDRELGSEVESLVNIANRTIKTGTQTLAGRMGVNFGFLFKKQPAFESGLATLRQTDPALADYLRAARLWTEPFVTLRNDIEHSIWSLPRVVYSNKDGRVDAAEPDMLGQPVTAFADTFFNRVACFFEEVIAHSMQRNMLPGTTLTEIPLSARAAEAPERFQITLATGGHPRWTITPHLKMFDQV